MAVIGERGSRTVGDEGTEHHNRGSFVAALLRMTMLCCFSGVADLTAVADTPGGVSLLDGSTDDGVICIYNGSQLTQMVKGNDTLQFTYDAAGTPTTLTYNGTVYYYVTNLQGDVVAILNSNGSAVVSYTYDAWGNPLSRTGSMANTLGTLNPLRYRGYVYDQETGLYYLLSRYYQPNMGRFLNADAFASTGQGLLGNNMFAYCGNNPVLNRDTQGTRHEISAGGGGCFITPAVEAVQEAVKKTKAGVKSPIGQSDYKEIGNKIIQTTEAIIKNIEVSAGVGLGLYGEVDLFDAAGLGLGINNNLIAIKFDNAKLTMEQTGFMGIEASLFGIDIIQDAGEHLSRKFSFTSPLEDYTLDGYNTNWTIFSAGAYFIAGGSIYVGLDTISLSDDLFMIYLYD